MHRPPMSRCKINVCGDPVSFLQHLLALFFLLFLLSLGQLSVMCNYTCSANNEEKYVHNKQEILSRYKYVRKYAV